MYLKSAQDVYHDYRTVSNGSDLLWIISSFSSVPSDGATCFRRFDFTRWWLLLHLHIMKYY